MAKTKRIGQATGLVAGLTKEDSAAAEAILDRLKQISNANSDSELASALGLKYSSVSSAKSRGMIPTAWIINTANLFGVSADWLIFGEARKTAEDKSTRCHTQAERFEVWQNGALKVAALPVIKDWVLELTPELFDTLWNRFTRLPSEIMRGWVQVEILRRFPEFLHWLENNEAELKREYTHKTDAPPPNQQTPDHGLEKEPNLD
ncbi:hypothetical protein C4J81_08205 [Deltaproteobacteria bacterium Smac51]|nr:hypothetical protein C4J81_08205 [Deltaproteobacteria bacterium Smac51]